MPRACTRALRTTPSTDHSRVTSADSAAPLRSASHPNTHHKIEVVFKVRGFRVRGLTPLPPPELRSAPLPSLPPGPRCHHAQPTPPPSSHDSCYSVERGRRPFRRRRCDRQSTAHREHVAVPLSAFRPHQKRPFLAGLRGGHGRTTRRSRRDRERHRRAHLRQHGRRSRTLRQPPPPRRHRVQ